MAEAGAERAVEMERHSGAMERFSGAGVALLPWTRHMIAVLWDQLRVLVQVIYYTFISVFQMFRFEVHVRITDDPSVAPDPSDPFLFSSLFSEEGGADHTEALLSTLRGEELCCDGEGGIFIGHKRPAGWSASVGDWNFFVSSSETRSSDEERSASCWSSEEEHLDFDCEESKALWESLSRSGDPYDPFCFSACLSTCSKALWESGATSAHSCSPVSEEKHVECKKSWETEYRPSPVSEETIAQTSEEKSEALWEASTSADACSPASDPDVEEDIGDHWETESTYRAPPAGRFWEGSSEEDSSDAEDSPGQGGGRALVQRSDSNSSWSSDFSDSSETSETREENQLLWDLFTSQEDPYNPLSFSATCRRAEKEEDPEEELWGLSKEKDPYHPLNFTAVELRGERRREEANEEEEQQQKEKNNVHRRASADTPQICVPRRQIGVKPSLTQRRIQRHTHPQVFLRPWVRPCPSADNTASSAPSAKRTSRTQRKVRFSPEVQVHIMRSWDFARRSCRRGVWEELARDRDRFKRRIQECERSVGVCLRAEHRQKVWRRIHPGPDED